MGLEIVNQEVMAKIDKTNLAEAVIEFTYGGKKNAIACHYNKCPNTGEIKICPDEADSDWPHDHPVTVTLHDHDGSRTSNYVGTFTEDGHFKSR